MHYVSTAERQIIKLNYKYIGNFNLSIMLKAEGQFKEKRNTINAV